MDAILTSNIISYRCCCGCDLFQHANVPDHTGPSAGCVHLFTGNFSYVGQSHNAFIIIVSHYTVSSFFAILYLNVQDTQDKCCLTIIL